MPARTAHGRAAVPRIHDQAHLSWEPSKRRPPGAGDHRLHRRAQHEAEPVVWTDLKDIPPKSCEPTKHRISELFRWGRGIRNRRCDGRGHFHPTDVRLPRSSHGHVSTLVLEVFTGYLLGYLFWRPIADLSGSIPRPVTRPSREIGDPNGDRPNECIRVLRESSRMQRVPGA